MPESPKSADQKDQPKKEPAWAGKVRQALTVISSAGTSLLKS